MIDGCRANESAPSQVGRSMDTGRVQSMFSPSNRATYTEGHTVTSSATGRLGSVKIDVGDFMCFTVNFDSILFPMVLSNARVFFVLFHLRVLLAFLRCTFFATTMA